MNLSFKDLKRFLTPIHYKIYRIIGKAILTALDNTGTAQKIQVSVLKYETVSNLEKAEEYGLSTYPKTGSQAIILSIGGNRDHAICINISDRRYRPTDLAEGEVAIYTHEDSTGDHRIHLKTGEIIEIKAGAGALTGVVTGACLCAFNGLVHPDVSTKVLASK